ncbi:Transcription initiation factor IIB [Gryganskiella cystojenkinii]|nr:Transcription initiation factor IIB [Gryganskiella cystojenkinii]
MPGEGTQLAQTTKVKGKGRGKSSKTVKGLQVMEAHSNQGQPLFAQESVYSTERDEHMPLASEGKSTPGKPGRKRGPRVKSLSQDQFMDATEGVTSDLMLSPKQQQVSKSGKDSGSSSPVAIRQRAMKREESSQSNLGSTLGSTGQNAEDFNSESTVKLPRPRSMLFGSGVILVDRLPGDSDPEDESEEGGGPASFPPAKYLSDKARAALGFGPKDSWSDQNAPSTGTETTLSSTVISLKKLRSRNVQDVTTLGVETQLGLESEDQQIHSVKGPVSPSNSKINLSSRRAGVVGTTDYDIEKSNQVTRSSDGLASMHVHSPTVGPSTTAASATMGSDGDKDKRQVKLKPKRLRIDDVDLRQLQRASSSIADPDSAASVQPQQRKQEKKKTLEKQEEHIHSGDTENGDNPEDDGSGSEDESPKVLRGARAVGDHRHSGYKDEPNDDGKGSGGSGGGSFGRRSDSNTALDGRSKGKDDHGGAGHGDSNGNTHAGNKKNSQGSNGFNRNAAAFDRSMMLVDSDLNSASRSGIEAEIKPEDQDSETAAQKIKKRKSNSNLIGQGVCKKSKDVSSATAQADAGVDSAGIAVPSPRRRARQKEEEEEERAAMDYLPMEDDISCPHLFGIEDSEREDEAMDEHEENDDDNEDEVMEEGLTEGSLEAVVPVQNSRGSDQSDSPPATRMGSGEDEKATAKASVKKTNGSGNSGNSAKTQQQPQQPLDPMDAVHAQGRDWVKRLAMPESAWEETFKTYERVKRLKELKNRQPVRKRDAILAAILYITCRDQGSPRTFSEICTASGVKRGDIGSYYRLMLKILEPSKSATASARDTDAEAFMTRWCESLSLPPQVRQAAVHVFTLANTLNLTSGKCPSSVGAAAIYLCIYSWNDARRLARCQRYNCPGCQGQGAANQSVSSSSFGQIQGNGSSSGNTTIVGAGASGGHPGADQDQGWIKKEQKDVATAVGVVSATLMGCFRNLAPERERLIPEEFLKAAAEGV